MWEIPEELDTHRVERICYTDRPGAHAMLLPRSLGQLKREILEKNWAEARQ